MTLNDKTTISVGLMIALIGGVVWLTRVSWMGEATATSLSDFKNDVKVDLLDIKKDIKEIKKFLYENRR